MSPKTIVPMVSDWCAAASASRSRMDSMPLSGGRYQRAISKGPTSVCKMCHDRSWVEESATWDIQQAASSLASKHQQSSSDPPVATIQSRHATIAGQRRLPHGSIKPCFSQSHQQRLVKQGKGAIKLGLVTQEATNVQQEHGSGSVSGGWTTSGFTKTSTQRLPTSQATTHGASPSDRRKRSWTTAPRTTDGRRRPLIYRVRAAGGNRLCVAQAL